MGEFALAINAFKDKTQAKADVAVRKISIDLLSRVVMRSPVGNPELWAVNAHAQYGRETHNLFVDQLNATLAVGDKKTKRLGKKKLASTYPHKAGKGYVGGRFRANWNTTIGSPSTEISEAVDPTGAKSIGAGVAALANFNAGFPIYIQNNLPYGPRLEYEGWSKQAPAGMVRVSIAEFQEIVSKVATELRT